MSSSSLCRGARLRTVASREAASVSSTFSRARAGSEYLSLITSPCSVNLISPSIDPQGRATRASYVGPPPRPTEPPRPWNRRKRTPCFTATSRNLRCARWISHWLVAIPASLFESEYPSMTSCISPRSATTFLYVGFESSFSRMSPAARSSATVSSSGAKPILATPALISTSPANFPRTVDAMRSSAPFVIETI